MADLAKLGTLALKANHTPVIDRCYIRWIATLSQSVKGIQSKKLVTRSYNQLLIIIDKYSIVIMNLELIK